MTRDYDAQLLESVAVRRARLRQVLVWGRDRRTRATVDNVKRFAISLVVAAVLSAGCVGWSFLQNVLAKQSNTGVRTTSSVPAVPGPTVTTNSLPQPSPTPGGPSTPPEPTGTPRSL